MLRAFLVVLLFAVPALAAPKFPRSPAASSMTPTF